MISVIANVVALYPSTSYENGLEALREKLFKSEDLKLPVNDVDKMAEFVLKNKIFEFKWEGLAASRENSNWY